MRQLMWGPGWDSKPGNYGLQCCKLIDRSAYYRLVAIMRIKRLK